MINLKGKRILLVDVEADIRDMLKDEFLLLGATVDEAGGGHSALEMVKAGDYDAVISDAKMPDGDGLELVAEIGRLGRKLPKTFLCTGMSAGDLGISTTFCVVAFFDKPLDFEKITTLVAASLMDLAS